MDTQNVFEYEMPSINESRTDLPEGSYVLELTGMKGPFDNKFNANVPRYLLNFKVVESPDDPDQEGKTAGFFYTMTNSPKGSLYPIYKALKGGNIDPDERWQLGSVIGKRFRATVVLKAGDQGGEPRPKIEGATPFRERKGKASEQPDMPF